MGFFEKIKQGLSKTASSISSVFTASELDDDFYDDLEERLILADLGMDTTVKAVERLRLVVRDRRIKTVAEAREALREVLPEAAAQAVYSYFHQEDTQCESSQERPEA